MENLTLVIGNQNYSSWSLRPWLFLSYHGIPFETRKVRLFTDEMDRELAPYFSDTKVPVLLHGETQVWDSLAILEYLAETFPECHGWPDGATARAEARAVAAEMHSSFPDLRTQLPMNCRRRFPGFRPGAAAQRDIARVDAVWRRCRQRHGGAEPWLFGGFSVADCMYAPVVLRFVSYGIELEGVSGDYLDHVYRSAAVQEWVRAGREEPDVIEEDEADWPSEPL